MDKFIRCQALTKKGTQCKTGAMSLTPFCGMHQGHVYRVEKVKYCTSCDTKTDGEHEYECVSQKRKVVVSFCFITEVPRSWDEDMINFYMNGLRDDQAVFNDLQDAVLDLMKTSPVDTSYTEEPDALMYRYVSEVNDKHLNRFAQVERGCKWREKKLKAEKSRR